MPTIKGKDGKSHFSMNPQVGKAMFGSAPGMDSMTEPGQDDGSGSDDSVELHKGGHPEGDPPPDQSTKYHTIHNKGGIPAEIKNHPDYPSADQHMQSCMGEGMDMGMDMGGSEPDGDEGGEE